MAETRKPRTKPGPTGKSQPGRGSGAGTAAEGPPAGQGQAGLGRRPAAGGEAPPADHAWSAVAVLSLLALIGLIVFMGRDEPQAENKPVTEQARAAAPRQAGSEGVKTSPVAGRDHIQPSQQPDNWNSTPPTSGDHLDTPLPAGVYDNEQDLRALVHNLEHGYVVIYYKGIPADQVEQLRQFVEARSSSKLVLAPWSGLESNGVALTAWQNLETMQRVNLDLVQAFVNDYMVPWLQVDRPGAERGLRIAPRPRRTLGATRTPPARMLPASISTWSPTTAPSRTTAPSPTTTPRPMIESDTLAPRSTRAPSSSTERSRRAPPATTVLGPSTVGPNTRPSSSTVAL